jgi:hypothetical protein
MEIFLKGPARLILGLSLSLALSCSKNDSIVLYDSGHEDSTVLPFDGDGDGVTVADGDCDDTNPEIYPGQIEFCNGLDDNCNGMIDEGFPDTDKDTIADCMDEEECDGLDNDGDGEVDEGFPDADGDGVADCLSEEICDGIDNDGDGEIDEGFDLDGDGYTTCNGDCDDDDASVNPGAEEDPSNGQDDDCDGITDESAWQEGSLRIVEIMNNPLRVGDPKGEWIELFNATADDLDLYGLELASSDGDSHVITESLILEAGGYAILAINGDPSSNGGVSADHIYSNVFLSNESDDLSLVMDGLTVDSLSWDNGATMPDPDGASIMLDPWGYTNGATGPDKSYWCSASTAWAEGSDLGSPGEENELCSTFDHDGDGMSGEEGDCNDLDPDIYLNAPEKDASKDNDCDGDVEHMPVAVVSYDGSTTTLNHCDGIYLEGSSSYDQDSTPNGGALTYTWELTSAPSNSALTSADIEEPTDADPVFIPDVSGTYMFTLTVNDGGTNSFPTTLALSIAYRSQNSTPVADAGAAQTYAESVTCTSTSYGTSYECDDCEDTDFSLSASGSTDSDGDELSYAWTVLTGSLTLDDSTIADPTATFTGPTAEYDSTNSKLGRVGLVLTDCYGATSSMDRVVLVFQCTGI